MKTNTKTKVAPVVTHEGAPAVRINAEKMLRRSLMSCLLFEKEFYEDGKTISDRLAELVPLVKPEKVALMAIEAREKMKLRHAPLFVVRQMALHESHRPFVADTLSKVIQRADELAEFLSMYWLQGGKQPIAHSVRRGLDLAIRKFDEYALAKYDRDGTVKLRDVFRLVHPHPENDVQSALWKRAVAGELATPDTWEVELSRNDGVSKKDKWYRLLTEKKLGGLALLRNLRNMEQADVPDDVIRNGIVAMSTYRVLPFRFIAAARHAPRQEQWLEHKFFECAAEKNLSGKTVILVDVSGSMAANLSAKSDMKREDAACGVAMVAREMCNDVEVYSFSNHAVLVPARRGFALRDAIHNSQSHGGTNLGAALKEINAKVQYDRIIVITDEQSHDAVGAPKGKGYVINVASARNGVGYGRWSHIDGFSESVFNYISEVEGEKEVG